jgi:hypothetical protein
MLIDKEIQQVREIQAGLQRDLEEIRAEAGLTNRERQGRMARVVVSARAQLRELRAASDAREGGEQRKAYIAAFGIDPSRAAEERALRSELAASAPGAVEVRDAMTEALRIGDTLAARVLAAYAWDHRNDELGGDYFRGTINAYADSSPEITRVITSVAALDGATGSSGPARLQRLQDKLLTEIPTPSDLPGNLEYLAADDPSPANSGAQWGQMGTAS